MVTEVGATVANEWPEAVRLAPWGRPPPFRPPTEAEAAELAAVYRRADRALEEISSSCRACGQCCRFGPDRPVLFASALELAYLVSRRGVPIEGRVPPGSPDAPWRCPYQEGRTCMARPERPLGCRTFFCDEQVRGRGEEVYAQTLPQIRQIAARGKGGGWYGPARFYFAQVYTLAAG